MTAKELQDLIDGAENSPDTMLKIGEGYLRGSVIRDRTAGLAWLAKVVKSGNTPEAVRAMRLLAEDENAGGRIISDRDLSDIRADAMEAQGKDREYLKELIKLGERERIGRVKKFPEPRNCQTKNEIGGVMTEYRKNKNII